MCGRFQIADEKKITDLMDVLGVDDRQPGLAFDIAPGARISIVRQTDAGAQVDDATWWLLLDTETHKPLYKYPSFNTRSDKLNIPRSAGYKACRETRCIIPATAFVEGLGDGKTYHKLEHKDRGIAFGGLYREWLNRETGEIRLSASIITLPPLENDHWKSTIHPKSLPLMLPQESDVIAAWLDPENKGVADFDRLLQPQLYYPLISTPIGRPSKWNPKGDSEIISAG
jgi:putative SOS response-associated peptidase YedK